MANLLLTLGFLLSLGVAAALIPWVKSLAFRKGWVDRPDGKRKLHARVTPSLGGLAIAGGFVAGLLYLLVVEPWLPLDLQLPSLGVWIGAAIMVATGFYDDVHHLEFKRKLAVQVVVAYILLHSGLRFDVTHLPLLRDLTSFQQALFAIPLTMLWIVGVINAVNLIDGMDGLAGGVITIAFLSTAIIFGLRGDMGIAILALPMVGALAGFLIYNTNPASIFMGDSGSLLLGMMIAVFTLQGQSHADPFVSILVPSVVLGLPILDTTLAMVRRFLSGKAICAPDHDHIHHRLLRLMPARRAVVVLYGVALWFGLVAVIMTLASTTFALVLLGMTLVVAYSGVRTLGYLGVRQSIRARREARVSVPELALSASRGDGHTKLDRVEVSTGAEGRPRRTVVGVGYEAMGPVGN